MERRSAHDALRGRRILVVEDDFLLAEDLRCSFVELGAEVIGPVASVAAALDLIAGTVCIDAATLDVNLGSEKAFPVADVLICRGVPCVFVTGYDELSLPERYRHIPRRGKPVIACDIARALFRGDG